MITQFLKINHLQAAIIICALDAYQAEGEAVLNSLDISVDRGEASQDVDILTGTIGAVENAKLIKENILNLFEA